MSFRAERFHRRRGSHISALFLCAMLSAMMHAAPAHAGVVYNQPSDFPTIHASIDVLASQDDTTPGGLGAFATDFAPFRLGTTAVITSVQWQGLYFAPPQAAISAFNLGFWSLGPPQLSRVAPVTPGNALLTTTIAGNANETFVGNESETATVNGTTSTYTQPFYNYSATLPTPFVAQAGTNYLLSIAAALAQDPSNQPATTWAWATGTGGLLGMPGYVNAGIDNLDPQDLPGARALTLDGLTPVLPSSIGSQGQFAFSNVQSGQWFDPATAYGFDYQMTTPGSLFTEIANFPTGFSGPFTISSGGAVLGTGAPGQPFVFADGGVSEFEITGISPLVDPTNTSAFPLQLDFSTPTADFTMTPLSAPSAVPEPTCLALLCLGAGGITLSRLRRPLQELTRFRRQPQ